MKLKHILYDKYGMSVLIYLPPDGWIYNPTFSLVGWQFVLPVEVYYQCERHFYEVCDKPISQFKSFASILFEAAETRGKFLTKSEANELLLYAEDMDPNPPIIGGKPFFTPHTAIP